MSLRGVIAAHGKSYTVTRLATGIHVDGLYIEGAPSTFPIVAYIEPTTGRELEDIPVGRRGNEIRTVYTETELRVGGDPDSIAIGGEPWTVISVEDYDALGGRHFRAHIARAAAGS